MKEQRKDLIGREKFREHEEELRRDVRAHAGNAKIVVRAAVRLIEDQLKEARTGEYVFQADEPKARRGGGRAPSPLQYFTASIGF